MSIIKLELKNEHLKLLKHIKWGEYDVETNTLLNGSNASSYQLYLDYFSTLCPSSLSK